MQAGMLSQDQRAFDSYVAFCGRVGTTPWGFEKWYVETSGINPSTDSSQDDFHKPTRGNHSLLDKSLRAKKAPVNDGWDGSWENAVRAIEEPAA